jgi:CheY-like chemotaxis protein
MSTEPQRPASILLVDDDKFLLDMYLTKFGQAGFVVHGCLSGSEALKVLRDGLKPDAVLFDILMPEGDGIFLLESLRKEKLAEDAVKIALTNEMSDDQKDKVAQLGGSLYLIKATLIPSEVVDLVRRELQKHVPISS